jgi:hypothetical protein
MAKHLTALSVISILTLLAGCEDAVTHADSLAQTAKMRRSEIKTDTFLLTSYIKVKDPSLPFTIYIEGDGFAWRTENEPSTNPTPHKALTLALASEDPSANVIYIARPCQFTPLTLDSHCNVGFWTDRRFSPEVIDSMNQAIDKLTKAYGTPRLNLIGYSGGGAVAVLIASRRKDVISVRTIAGNLDHEEVNRLNEVTPMQGSLNAIDAARAIASIPQLHFSGGEDEIISPVIAERFLASSQPTDCIRLEIIPEASHEDGWIERWPDLLKVPVNCGRSSADFLSDQ